MPNSTVLGLRAPAATGIPGAPPAVAAVELDRLTTEGFLVDPAGRSALKAECPCR